MNDRPPREGPSPVQTNERRSVDTISDADFARLLEQAVPGLLSLARRLAPSGTDPADLVQDALERAWASRARLHDPARAEAWVRRILVNRVRDVGRRTTLREEVAYDDELPHGDDASLAAQLIANEASATLRAVLPRLAPEAIVAVVLRDGEDWSPAEIAELVGTTEAATHKRIQRGRAQLAEAMLAPAQRALQPSGPLCAHVHELARAHLDGALSTEDQAALQEHLAACTYCPVTVRAVEAAITLLRDRGAPTPEQLARLRQAARPIDG
jgi:RNA polymerase sigma factor (sigma-70 family)